MPGQRCCHHPGRLISKEAVPFATSQWAIFQKMHIHIFEKCKKLKHTNWTSLIFGGFYSETYYCLLLLKILVREVLYNMGPLTCMTNHKQQVHVAMKEHLAGSSLLLLLYLLSSVVDIGYFQSVSPHPWLSSSHEVSTAVMKVSPVSLLEVVRRFISWCLSWKRSVYYSQTAESEF